MHYKNKLLLSAVDCLLFQDKLAFIASFKIHNFDGNYSWQKSENLARFVPLLEKQELIKDSSWISITVPVIAFDTIYGGRTEAWFLGKCRMFCCLLNTHSCVSQSLSWKTQTLLGKCLSLVTGCVQLGAPSLLVTRDGEKKMVLGVVFFLTNLFFLRPPEFTFLTQKHLKQRLAPKHKGKDQICLRVMCSLWWRMLRPRQSPMTRTRTETWWQRTRV